VVPAFTCPYIIVLKGNFEVILILAAVVWFIANLLKKASQASKGPPAERPRPRMPLDSETERPPRAPSLSQFFRTLKEMSEEQAKPRPPQQPKAEQPRSDISMPTPPPPEPSIWKEPMPRPVPVRRPTLRQVRQKEKPREPQLAPGLGAPLAELPEVEAATLKPLPSVSLEAPETYAYAIKGPEAAAITRFLGREMSASEVRKGIILAVVLGAPKAVRGRRVTFQRR